MSKSSKNLNYGTFPIHTISTPINWGGTVEARYRHPALKSAEMSAAVFRRAIRLAPADLLADPEFRRLARAAAERGKAFTSDLLAWEQKDVVARAVAVVRAEVDAERAEAERVAADAEAARKAREAAERPTRDAVNADYEKCGYRTCTQGHTTRIVVGDSLCGNPVAAPGSFADGRPWTGARSHTERGDHYSSRCTYRKTESVHTLYVRADWLTRVSRTGGGVFDGALVLDAEAVGCLADDRIVYELKIVRQGAGTALNTETASATVVDGEWVPAPKRTANKALRMPAPILADYLEDRGAPTADVMPLRAGYAG